MKRKAWLRLFKDSETPFSCLKEIIPSADENLIKSVNSDLHSALMLTILNKREEQLIIELLKKGADTAYGDTEGMTPLHLAVSHYRGDVIRQLIDAGSNVNAQNNTGETPLMIAAARSVHIEVIETLLAYGADKYQRNSIGAGVAIYAAMNHEIDYTQFLEKHNFDMAVTDFNGQNSLHMAIRSDQSVERIAQLIYLPHTTLIDNSSLKNPEDKYIGKYSSIIPLALILASMFSTHDEILDLLLSSGDNIDECDTVLGRTALMHAVASEQAPERIEKLIQKGAFIDAKDNDGMTPLMIAAAYNHSVTLYSYLIERHADTSIKNNSEKTARDLALSRWTQEFQEGLRQIVFQEEWKILSKILETEPSSPDLELLRSQLNTKEELIRQQRTLTLVVAIRNRLSVELLKTLLNKGMNPNALTSDDSILMYALKYKASLETIELLLAQGADVTPRNKIGERALTLAIKKRASIKIIKALIDAGAPIEAQDREAKTAIHYAIEHPSSTRILHLLIGSGANIHAKDSQKQTALMIAAIYSKSLDTIRLLLDSGADINAMDDNHSTSLMFAAKYNKSVDIIRFLLDSGADINAMDIYGNNSLIYALESADDNSAIIQELLLRDPIMLNDHYSLLIKLDFTKVLDIHLKILKDIGISLDSTNSEGETVLMYKASHQNVREVKALIAAGADVTIKDNEGMPAFYYSVEDYMLYGMPHKLTAMRIKIYLSLIQIFVTHDTVENLSLVLNRSFITRLFKSLAHKGVKIHHLLHSFTEAGVDNTVVENILSRIPRFEDGEREADDLLGSFSD